MLVYVFFVQSSMVPEEFLPKQYMKFDELDGAYEYYCECAKMAGFDVRNGRKSPQVQRFFFVTSRGITRQIVQVNKRRRFYEDWVQRTCEGET
jgi:hypothetical protein